MKYLLAVLLLCGSFSAQADEDGTKFSGFAYWTHAAGKEGDFNLTLEQVWLQGERTISKNLSVDGTMAVQGQPRLVQDFKLVWSRPLEKFSDWDWTIDKITVGRFIPPLGWEWPRFRADQFETIRPPTETRWLVTRDDGAQIDGGFIDFKWNAAIFGANERLGGLPAERSTGHWHTYFNGSLDLDEHITVGGGVRLSPEDRMVWDANAVYQTEKGLMVFEEVGYRDKTASPINPSEESYLAAYSLASWLRLVGRYEDRYGDLNHFTAGIRLAFDHGEMKSNMIWPQGHWGHRLFLNQFVLRF